MKPLLCLRAQLDMVAIMSNHIDVQAHVSTQRSPKSNIIAAVIVAAGLIVSAIIVAKPTLPSFALNTPPIPTSSVESQFAQQMKTYLKSKQHIHFSNKTTLKDVEFDEVKYSSDNKSFFVYYFLVWQGYIGKKYYEEAGRSGTGCTLTQSGNGYTGQCDAGENFDAQSKRLSYPKVNISVQ